MDDMALLREYATGNSETAFETLVSRRVGFVYSMALRQTRDPHLAGEVTQAVFIILAQKAGRISGKTILAGWLFRTTRFAALAQMRADAKRRRREQEANMQSEIQPTAPDAFWEQMSPLLDEALATLGETDRQAVLLRFFENKSLAEVGRSLGTGEDTARKRVSRALDKLHRYFSKHGVSSNDGRSCRGDFRQFRSSRAGGAGKNHYRCRDGKGSGGGRLDPGSDQRCFEADGLAQRQSRDHHRRGDSGGNRHDSLAGQSRQFGSHHLSRHPRRMGKRRGTRHNSTRLGGAKCIKCSRFRERMTRTKPRWT